MSSGDHVRARIHKSLSSEEREDQASGEEVAQFYRLFANFGGANRSG